MRWVGTVALAVLCGSLHAQLGLGGDAGASLLPIPKVVLAPTNLPVGLSEAFSLPTVYGTRAPSPPTLNSVMSGDTGFDYAAVKPHLAFFCRLELRIEEETQFPVRFRLGEVRGWQQELSKRD